MNSLFTASPGPGPARVAAGGDSFHRWARRGGLVLAAGMAAVAITVPGAAGIAAAAGLAGLAVSGSFSPGARNAAFSLWVVVFALAALSSPGIFIAWGGFPLRRLITPLVQLIMFGMGTTLAPADFLRLARMPHGVLTGVVLQFGIMPAAGYWFARLFHLDPLVGVGLILVGSCPGGVSSNVITYIARGNVALSVTMTACSTMLSPQSHVN